MGCIVPDRFVIPKPELDAATYRKLRSGIDRYAWLLIPGRDQREDFVSEVLCFRLLPHLYDEQGQLTLPSYRFVWQAVRWAWINQYRREQSRPPLQDEQVELDALSGGEESDPAAMIEADDTLKKGLQSLKPSDRVVYIMTELEARRVQEVAKVLGLTVGAIHRARYRAQKKLKKVLQSQDGEY